MERERSQLSVDPPPLRPPSLGLLTIMPPSNQQQMARAADDAERGLSDAVLYTNYTFHVPTARGRDVPSAEDTISSTITRVPSTRSPSLDIRDMGFRELRVDLPSTPMENSQKRQMFGEEEKPMTDPNSDEKRRDLHYDHSHPLISDEALVPIPRPKKGEPPSKPRHHTSKWTKITLWYNTYRKLFTIAVTLNIIGIILKFTGHFQYSRLHPGAMVLGNLTAAVLVRNELFTRFLFLIANTLFAKWTPLWFRLTCTSVLQHLGGIHSGCAISGFTWLTINVVEVFIRHAQNHNSILSLGVCTDVAIFISILAGLPWVRNTHHNVFERWHRFVGWTGLILTWVYVLLVDLWDWPTHSFQPTGWRVFNNQAFWFILVITFCIVWPWSVTRSVPVQIEIPSPKVAIIRFDRGMQWGLLGRISRSFAKEYHTFGLVSTGRDSPYHYMICGVQGDFTKGIVNNPPSHLYTRELKLAGVTNTTHIYKRGIRVCTGTGLGSGLATCMQDKNWFLIWIGSDQEKTFGPTINGLIRDHVEPERCLLWDSKQRGGRPDIVRIIREVYTNWGAEVVFITSNWDGNKEMMEGCKEAGIPAFGTLWDF